MLNYLFLMVGVLLNVAFITLLERKILGYSQIRLGPNKPGLLGVVQPFSDALKLFLNKTVGVLSMYWLGKVMPKLSLGLVLLLWASFPLFFLILSLDYSVLFLLVLLSVSIYPVMLMGWSSYSKYAQLGAIRNVAQSISYEVSLALVLLILIFLEKFLSFSELTGSKLSSMFVIPWLLSIWLITMLSETNRSPFDFSESESELVSGFNVEYSSYNFALIFMSEYGSIYFFSGLSSMLFFSSGLMVIFGFMVFLFFWVWVRSTLPRYRYDLLMDLNWKLILPLLLMIIFWLSLAEA